MLKLKTPSKINLYLKITGKLPNGYHEIETVFLPLIDISDIITINEIDSGITVTSNRCEVPLDETNLCFKAAKLYSEITGININCNIDIQKSIPIAAGMGGGSSDAAAVLLLLQKKYNAMPEKQLKAAALKLGADVPYFLNPVPALGKGVGEDLNEVDLAEGLYIVILAPQYPISAAWAYKHFKRPENTDTKPVENILSAMKSGKWKKLTELIYNDLAFAIYDKFPIQNILKQEMLNSGILNVEITGSGPTLFGICENKEKALEAVKMLNKKYPESFYCGYSKV